MHNSKTRAVSVHTVTWTIISL